MNRDEPIPVGGPRTRPFRLLVVRLTALLPLLLADPTVDGLVAAAAGRSRTDRSVVVPPGARPAVLAAMTLGEAGIARATGAPERAPGTAASADPAPVPAADGPPLLVITATGREAEETAAALACYLPADDVAVFPAWETLPHERLSPRADTVATRLAVLRRLAHPEDERTGAARTAGPGPSGAPDPGPSGAPDPERGPIRVLVVPVRALLAPIVEGLGDLEPVHLAKGLDVGLQPTAERLAAAAYTRVDMVENRGEFAVRGGILDVFPPTRARPVRVDFFGDEIESVSTFAVADQRTIEEVGGVTATACREIILTDAVRERARRLTGVIPGAADMLDRIAEGVPVEGMESLAPVLVDRMVPLLDLVGDRLVVVLEPERVRKRAEDLVSTTAEFLAAAWTSAASGGTVPIDLSAAAFAPLAEARALALSTNRGWWSLTSFAASPDVAEPALRDPERYRGRLEEATADLGDLAREGWSVIVTTDGPGPGRRMAQLLADSGVPARIVTQLDEPADLGDVAADGTVRGDGVIRVTQAGAGHGFVARTLRLALIAESDLTGRAKAGPRERRTVPARRSRKSVDPLSLRPGDFVVHAQHGVGRFVELMRRRIGSGRTGAKDPAGPATREYLVIEYAASKRGQPGDRLLVPTDSLDQVTKYIGGETPVLNKMGGADWARTKSRARKAVREIAGELVRLYAARSATTGHAFGPDTPWQAELEEAFPYTETPDQLATIDDVKRDMEAAQPMDRLICGDVGYGKTEIAVRAAFKAVQEGKQVVVLVPTTLLVTQHAETFSERYAGFPVRVAQLSRFQTPAESAKVLAGLADGTIDVVVGTHRLITGRVHVKNLGLVIIDEEQRFGVEHKETLKALRTDVDVLSMSATPIPRTLEMAISGIREMSILQTPPEERQPVLTFVGAYTDAQVSAAIRRELLRDGQVFYVHNRVDSIASVAAHIAELVPEARVRTAHGKMNEHQLEAVIQDFWNHEFDVLVCTTIVETGLDISNANTLIVDRADTFGLSQLHQLRGRVGRGRERAYAYFFYPGDKALTETAHERLKTIAANTELGAGLAVAQRDLEIRGAGNLLGGAQSGHVEGVGFDLYVRMVSDAVAAYRGDAPAEKTDVRMDLQVDAHIPDGYVGGERLRLEVYAKIAAIATPEQEADVREELVDRYGPIPPQVDLLFSVARLREIVRRAGITEVVTQGKYLRVSPVELRDSQVMRLKRLHPGTVIKAAVRQVLVPLPLTSRVGGSPLTDGPLLEWVETLVTKILVPFGE